MNPTRTTKLRSMTQLKANVGDANASVEKNGIIHQ